MTPRSVASGSMASVSYCSGKVTQRKNPPWGVVQRTPCGHFSLQASQHGVAPKTIDLPRRRDVLIEKIPRGVVDGPRHDPLVVDVRPLFDIEECLAQPR